MIRQAMFLFAGATVAIILGTSVAGATSEKTLHTFCSRPHCADGDIPLSGLVNVNGILYGTTEYGGSRARGEGLGVVYAVDPKSGNETVVHTFTNKNIDGELPHAGLIAVGGLLYGTTADGGQARGHGEGTVFSLEPVTGAETILHSFVPGGDGLNPMAGLIDVNGMLYGTTSYGGGTSDAGTVFAVDLTSGTETVLYAFQNNGVDGYLPKAGLLARNDELYGTTAAGGINDGGTVFAIDLKTDKERVLHAFSGPDGSAPDAALIVVNGILYSTTGGGGAYNNGTVFSIDPKTGTETVVYSFCKENDCADGAIPGASLVDIKGVLYGTTLAGGANNCGYYGCGSVFALDPATGTETVLYSFCSQPNCTDGLLPEAGLLDVGGTLFGTTPYVTLDQCKKPAGYCGGVVFSLKP